MVRFCMMHRVTVTATRDVEYEGCGYEKGDTLEVKPLEALALAYARKVSLTPVVRTRVLAPEPVPIPTTPRRRRRQTADPDRPKRTYRRRDLNAESPTE